MAKMTFEELLEDYLQSLRDRERPPRFGKKRVEEIRDFIRRKQPFENPGKFIAKDIRGLDNFKKVMALASISPMRPIHIVAVGDPATGKSQVAAAFQSITPQSRYCLGSKLTAAGLTLARRGKDLMEGVLPACHVGAAYIDEFNLCKSEDAAAVLSTMQDGNFSVDKAFLKAQSVPAKASIVAMANPLGDYWLGLSPHQIRAQLPFRSLALLTRFHLIYLVLRPTVEEFEEISEHQLKYRAGSRKTITFNKEEKELWRDAVLYLRHVRPGWGKMKVLKRKLISTFTTEAYREERKGRISIPISPRVNEGTVHLSEAVAKARLHRAVWLGDVLKGIQLMVNSLIPCGLNHKIVEKRLSGVLKRD